MADILLGHDSLDGYLNRKTNPYFGSLVGRFANRIGGAAFTLDGVKYQLAKNDGENTLHGGTQGSGRRGLEGGARQRAGRPSA